MKLNAVIFRMPKKNTVFAAKRTGREKMKGGTAGAAARKEIGDAVQSNKRSSNG